MPLSPEEFGLGLVVFDDIELKYVINNFDMNLGHIFSIESQRSALSRGMGEIDGEKNEKASAKMSAPLRNILTHKI